RVGPSFEPRFRCGLGGWLGLDLRLGGGLGRGCDISGFELDRGRVALGLARIRRRFSIFQRVVGHRSDPLTFEQTGAYQIRRLSYASYDRKARSSAANKAFSSGDAATCTWAAPASRKASATLADRQHCSTDSAEISTPSDRAASMKARAERWE